MTGGEFNQYIDQVYAVRKCAGREETKREMERGATDKPCTICGRPGHTPANCYDRPREITQAFNDYFVDKNCHACQAVGHGWRSCLNLYAKLRHGTKLESDPNPPAGVSDKAKQELSTMLAGLGSFSVKNQDKNKERLLPPGTHLTAEGPIQPKRRKQECRKHQ